MTLKSARDRAVGDAVSRIKAILSDRVTVPGLEAAKAVLLELCTRRELFPRSDFPLPNGDPIARTFLLHEEADGSYALYVNSSLPGQESRPHDHGGSWAIVAAVEGEETHRLFVCDEAAAGTDDLGLRQVTELVVRPGSAVSLMPDGIHSIHATAGAPLLHLHLYGQGFPSQAERREFDRERAEVRRFVLEDIGSIEDAR